MVDYTLSNTLTFNNLKEYFFVLNNDFKLEDGYLIFKNKRLNLQGFDLREVIYVNNSLILNNLGEGKITTANFFDILKIYEFKDVYLEHEKDFYANLIMSRYYHIDSIQRSCDYVKTFTHSDLIIIQDFGTPVCQATKQN